jgi:hypothetical protein
VYGNIYIYIYICMDKRVYMYCVSVCLCVRACVRACVRERDSWDSHICPNISHRDVQVSNVCASIWHAHFWVVDTEISLIDNARTTPSTFRLIQTGRGPQTHTYLNTHAWGRECHSICISDYPSSVLFHVTALLGSRSYRIRQKIGSKMLVNLCTTV